MPDEGGPPAEAGREEELDRLLQQYYAALAAGGLSPRLAALAAELERAAAAVTAREEGRGQIAPMLKRRSSG